MGMKKVFLALSLLFFASAAAAEEDDTVAFIMKDGLVVRWSSYYLGPEDNYCANLSGGTVCIPKSDVLRVVTGSEARKIGKTVRSGDERVFQSPPERATGGHGRTAGGGREPGVSAAGHEEKEAAKSGGVLTRSRAAVEKFNESSTGGQPGGR
ncbi:MAG: hypothetical protein HZB33_04785 [Nitrospirae bacterium]|nr:hypothetical protein [Nitrospirota bacterium]